MTNGDKIRAMSDEELARHFADSFRCDCYWCPISKLCDSERFTDTPCHEVWLAHLRQEAEDERD